MTSKVIGECSRNTSIGTSEEIGITSLEKRFNLIKEQPFSSRCIFIEIMEDHFVYYILDCIHKDYIFQFLMKNPYYSVILPTFNSGKTLNSTLQSLSLQTFKNFELIIIDDCSDDINTITDTIHSFNDKLNYKFIKHKKQNGAAARNTGIRHARGKFICFIDSDDTWDSNRLEYLKDFIIKNKICDNIIIYGKVKSAMWRNIIY